MNNRKTVSQRYAWATKASGFLLWQALLFIVLTCQFVQAETTTPPSAACHVTDGQFTTCATGTKEWDDIPPISFSQTNAYLYADQADLSPLFATQTSDFDTLMLLYDECGRTTPLGKDEYVRVSFNTVEKSSGKEELQFFNVHLFGDGTITFIKDGVPSPEARTTVIQGQRGKVGFGKSPNCDFDHVVAEYQIELDAASGHSYSPDPIFWGGSIPESCGDGIDNNGNGQIDEGCPPPPQEVCSDGIDNDGDGQIDEGCPPPGPRITSVFPLAPTVPVLAEIEFGQGYFLLGIIEESDRSVPSANLDILEQPHDRPTLDDPRWPRITEVVNYSTLLPGSALGHIETPGGFSMPSQNIYHTWKWMDPIDNGLYEPIDGLADFSLAGLVDILQDLRSRLASSAGGLVSAVSVINNLARVGVVIPSKRYSYTVDASDARGNAAQKTVDVDVFASQDKRTALGQYYVTIAAMVGVDVVGIIVGAGGGLPVSAALFSVGLGMNVALSGYFITAADPDPNYTVVVGLTPLTSPTIDSLPPSPGKDLAQSWLRAGNWLKAFSESVSKYEGAKLAGDREWMRLQIESAQGFHQELLKEFVNVKNHTEVVITQLKGMGITLDSNDLMAAKTELESSGLRPIQITMLQELGFDAADIDGFRRAHIHIVENLPLNWENLLRFGTSSIISMEMETSEWLEQRLAALTEPTQIAIPNDPLLKLPVAVTTDGTYLYIASMNASCCQTDIVRMPITGGPAERLYTISGPSTNVGQIALNGSDLFVIDAQSGPFTDTQIFRAPKDGSGSLTAIYTGSAAGNEIVDGGGIVTDGAFLYTADYVQGRIHRLNFDATGITTIVSSRYGGFFDTERKNSLALNNDILYIADAGRSGVAVPEILSIPKTGGSFTSLWQGAPLVSPRGIAILGDEIFLVDPGANNTIWRLPLTGGQPQAMVSNFQFTNIYGITAFGNNLYVTDEVLGLVQVDSGFRNPTDSDRDDIVDEVDNCPSTPNTNQNDAGLNGIGDSCENPADLNFTAAFIKALPDGSTFAEPWPLPIEREPDLTQRLIAIVDFRLETGLSDSAETLTDNLVDSLVRIGLVSASDAPSLVDTVLASVSPPNRPPVADAGPDQNVACTSQGAANVALNGAGSSDPDNDSLSYTWTGPFGTATGVTPTVSCSLGTNTILLTVDDGKGGTASDSVAVNVTDTAAPVIQSAAASPSTLFPPNHAMLPVTVAVSANDLCSSTANCEIVEVSSNEPVNGTSDGDIAPDWQITGSLTLNLRAERAPNGTGRIYTISLQCTDLAGNSTSESLTVSVPAVCSSGDIDCDGDVDRDDLDILISERNKTVPESDCGAKCDLDGDGRITGLDARKLVALCTRPNCSTQ